MPVARTRGSEVEVPSTVAWQLSMSLHVLVLCNFCFLHGFQAVPPICAVEGDDINIKVELNL